MEKYFPSREAVHVRFELFVDQYTRTDNLEVWVLFFFDKSTIVQRWETNMPAFPFKYDSNMPPPTLSNEQGHVIVGEWKQYGFDMVYDQSTKTFTVEGVDENSGSFRTQNDSFSGVLTPTGMAESINRMGNATLTGNMLYFHIGNEYPVTYSLYPPPTVTINIPTDMFKVVIEQDSAVSIVDENGSVLFLVDGLVTNNYISRLTKPYPKKVGWMDLYGVVSELANVPPIPSVLPVVIPVIITTIYNSTTRTATITPSVVLPSDSTEVFFTNIPAERVGNNYTLTLSELLSDGVYIPSVMSSDEYVFSYVGLMVGGSNNNTSSFDDHVPPLLISIGVSICFAAAVMGLSLK